VAGTVTAGLAESNGSLLPSGRFTCGLTACTPGSAVGPTIGNEHGKPFNLLRSRYNDFPSSTLQFLPILPVFSSSSECHVLSFTLITEFVQSFPSSQFVIHRLGLDMINLNTKYEVSTITCNEDMKSNTKICKNCRFEPPFGDLGVTHRVHQWLDGKRIVDFLLVIIELCSVVLIFYADKVIALGKFQKFASI